MEVYSNGICNALRSNNKYTINEILPLRRWSRHVGYQSLKTRLFFRYFIYPLIALFKQGDINHVIDQTYGHLLYLLKSNKTIITVHDLDVLRLKNIKWTTFRDKILRQLYLFSVRAIRRARLVIAVSNDTKNDVVNFLKIDPKKVVVIGEGVEEIFNSNYASGAINEVKKKYNLPNKYILHVGQCWQYKNLEGILKVFNLCTKEDRGKDLFFVKVGGEWSNEHKKLIKRYGIRDKVIKLPFLPREDLPLIYCGAVVLLQLSFLEGFGLTVLEAMSCGCPVVVSNAPALVELVSRSGFVFDLTDQKNIVRKIIQLADDPVWRKYWSSSVIKQAKKNSWDIAAKMLEKEYAKI